MGIFDCGNLDSGNTVVKFFGRAYLVQPVRKDQFVKIKRSCQRFKLCRGVFNRRRFADTGNPYRFNTEHFSGFCQIFAAVDGIVNFSSGITQGIIQIVIVQNLFNLRLNFFKRHFFCRNNLFDADNLPCVGNLQQAGLVQRHFKSVVRQIFRQFILSNQPQCRLVSIFRLHIFCRGSKIFAAFYFVQRLFCLRLVGKDHLQYFPFLRQVKFLLVLLVIIRNHLVACGIFLQNRFIGNKKNLCFPCLRNHKIFRKVFKILFDFVVADFAFNSNVGRRYRNIFKGLALIVHFVDGSAESFGNTKTFYQIGNQHFACHKALNHGYIFVFVQAGGRQVAFEYLRVKLPVGRIYKFRLAENNLLNIGFREINIVFGHGLVKNALVDNLSQYAFGNGVAHIVGQFKIVAGQIF